MFFTAHPGDKSIAMAGDIQHHADVGRQVFVELLTHGGAALASTGKILGDGKTCEWHAGTHDYQLTAKDFEKAFVAKFTEAIAMLGVIGIYVSNFIDGKLQISDVNQRLNWWLSNASPEIGIKGIAGQNDPRSDGTYNSDNVAVWDVLVSSGISDIHGYLIYHYISDKGTAFFQTNIE